jgi:tetratricopeptide (TPR) repeat protein
VPHQPLAGQLVVFTGKLSSLGRREARALVARLGGATADEVNAKTTLLVIGAERAGAAQADRDAVSGPGREEADTAGDSGSVKSHKLLRAEELNAGQPGRIRILSEDEFCRLAAVPTPDALKQQYHALRDLLSRYRALGEDHLRYLVKCGILQPVLRTNADTFFAFPDLATIRQANEDLASGRSFRRIVRELMASRRGQLRFDFADAPPAKILTLRRPASDRPVPAAERVTAVPERNSALAEEYFREGSALDDGTESTREDAAAAYRKALDHDPCLVPALINLANIHYSRDELVEAQALYERAIALESDFFEAHFNLGNIYHDLGRFDEAQACYREALRLNPSYPDAHFYLAVTFEKMGQSQDARPHWRAYRQLAPHGEWVELAEELSD